MNPDMFLELLNGMSTLAELNGLYYKQLLHNGFTPEQAMELVKVMTVTIMTPKEDVRND